MPPADETPDPFDLTTPAAVLSPYPLYRKILAESPTHFSKALGGWVLSRHQDVASALRSPQLSCDRFAPIFRQLPPAHQEYLRPIADVSSRWTAFMDPPQHTRMRALSSQAFSPARVQAMRPRVKQLIDAQLQRLVQRANFDFVHDFCREIPTIVIAEIIGVPPGDRAIFREWVTPLVQMFGTASPAPEVVAAARQATLDMVPYLKSVVAERRKVPREDVISTLLRAEEQQQKMTEDELVADCISLINAGHETTRSMLSTGTLLLLRHPDQLQRLCADPSLMPAALDEILRYESPVQRTSRMVRDTGVLFGQQMQAGQIIWVLLGAANRDPEQFPDPDRFDIGRHPNKHLAFGGGPHFCEGAPLGRIEGELAFTALLPWLPRMRLVDETPDWLPAVSATRSLRSLRIALS